MHLNAGTKCDRGYSSFLVNSKVFTETATKLAVEVLVDLGLDFVLPSAPEVRVYFKREWPLLLDSSVARVSRITSWLWSRLCCCRSTWYGWSYLLHWTAASTSRGWRRLHQPQSLVHDREYQDCFGLVWTSLHRFIVCMRSFLGEPKCRSIFYNTESA